MIRKIVITILCFSATLAILTGCGSKYCTVAGCPKESASGCNYCYQHKCSNFSCDNIAIDDYSYCMECIERAK